MSNWNLHANLGILLKTMLAIVITNQKECRGNVQYGEITVKMI